MKYLKKLIIKESIEMLDSNYIGDILSDIIDNDYKVLILTQWSSTKGENMINITIHGIEENKQKIIYLDDIIQPIQSLCNYLKTEGYYPFEDSKNLIELIESALEIKNPTTEDILNIRKENQFIKYINSLTNDNTDRWCFFWKNTYEKGLCFDFEQI